MSNRTLSSTRREFIRAGLAGAALLPIPAVLATRAVAAAELPRLEETDRSAKALGYVHDAGRVEAETRGGVDRICRSCRFYTDSSAGQWGPCTLFPGKAVNANGWCRGWVAESS